MVIEAPTSDRLARRAQVVKAMAHPTRLLFVEALAEGELCVCELNEMVDADVSTVSRHLSILRHAGIVDVVLEEQTGLLVDEFDIHGMSQHMLRLVDDPQLAERVAAAGREKELHTDDSDHRKLVGNNATQFCRFFFDFLERRMRHHRDVEYVMDVRVGERPARHDRTTKPASDDY